jgi:hypothetical protein
VDSTSKQHLSSVLVDDNTLTKRLKLTTTKGVGFKNVENKLKPTKRETGLIDLKEDSSLAIAQYTASSITKSLYVDVDGHHVA